MREDCDELPLFRDEIAIFEAQFIKRNASVFQNKASMDYPLLRPAACSGSIELPHGRH
jgi:hypothetical protein